MDHVSVYLEVQGAAGREQILLRISTERVNGSVLLRLDEMNKVEPALRSAGESEGGGSVLMVSTETRHSAGNRYRDLFLHMMDGFVVHEILLAPDGRPRDFKFLEVNPAFEHVTGLKASDVIGRTGREVFPGDDPDGSEFRRWRWAKSRCDSSSTAPISSGHSK